MQIPIDTRSLNDKEIELLRKLGFDVDNLEYRGNYDFLEIPKKS